MSNGEPWEFFKTIENTVKRLETVETTALDGAIVGILAFGYAFAAFHESAPHRTRVAKDELMLRLKKWPLSQQMVDALEGTMLDVCDGFEGRG